MTLSLRLSLFALAIATAAPVSWSKGSAADGATKATTCLACHGANGNSVNAEWPSLAGQNAAYIAKQLHLYHDGKRTGPPGDATVALMPPMAATLTDQDIEDIAAYYAAQTPAGLEADAEFWEAGRKLYLHGDRTRQIPACAACHGPTGAGTPTSGYPALRAQHAVYTAKQLRNFHAQTRYTSNEKGVSAGGENAEIMRTIASRLTEDDFRNLAAFIQGLR